MPKLTEIQRQHIHALLSAGTFSAAELSKHLGISETTARKWAKRPDAADRSHARTGRMRNQLHPNEIKILILLRKDLGFSVDQLLKIAASLGMKASRSTIHNLIQRHYPDAVTPRRKSEFAVITCYNLFNKKLLLAVNEKTLTVYHQKQEPLNEEEFIREITDGSSNSNCRIVIGRKIFLPESITAAAERLRSLESKLPRL